jgi:hypothetical protein
MAERTNRGVLAGFALAALGGVLAGCTDSPGSTPASDGPAKAPVAYRNIKALAGHIDASEAKAKTAHVRFATSGARPAIEGTGQLDLSNPHRPALSMTATEGKQHLRVVLRGATFYVRNPHPPTGVKPWVKIDADGHDPGSKTFGAVLSGLTHAADPSQALHTLAGAGTITGSRTRDYHGRVVRRYTIELDSEKLTKEELERLAETLPTGKRHEFSAKLTQAPGNITAHVLVDHDDLPVRVTASFPGSGQGQARFTTTLSQWGTPVHITAPPAKKVRTLLTAGH